MADRITHGIRYKPLGIFVYGQIPITINIKRCSFLCGELRTLGTRQLLRFELWWLSNKECSGCSDQFWVVIMTG